MKRCILTFAILSIFVTVSVWANGQQENAEWPNKTITMVCPYGAGGDTDFNTRTYAKYLEKILGVSIVVVNTQGAGGSLAAESVLSNPNDGYTIFFANTGYLLNNVTGISDFRFDEAFDPIGIVARSAGEAVVVRSDCPANTIRELIELTKTNPNKYRLTSVTGGIMHYFAIRLNDLGGHFNLVDAGGANDRTAALLGGHVDAIVNTIGTVWPYVESGDLKILAVTAEDRSSAYPDIPTCKEQDVNLTIGLEYNMLVKKGTDPDIIKKLSDAVAQVSQMKEYKNDIYNAYKQSVYILSPEKSRERLISQSEEFMRYQDLFKGL